MASADTNPMSAKMGGPGNPFGAPFMQTVVWLLSIFSMPLEVTMRRRFGLRYVGIPTIMAMATVFSTTAIATFALGAAGNRFDRPWIAMVFSWLICLLAIFHRVSASRREQRGELWHSFAQGTSHVEGTLPVSIPVLQRYLEPLLGFVAGLLLFIFFNRYLGGMLMVGGVCLLVKEQIRHNNQRHRYLDMIDAIIEGEAVQKLNNKGWWDDRQITRDEGTRHDGYFAYVPPKPKLESHAAAYVAAIEQANPGSSAKDKWSNYDIDGKGEEKVLPPAADDKDHHHPGND